MTKTLEKVIELWNRWEIRALVLLSLLLQAILSVVGAQRKREVKIWIRLLVWTAYLSADWVATVALGILARTPGGDSRKDSLQSFWAPFLLLHLGGPDTITAYSLEDTELWPRHLLALVFQTGVALYVLYRSWSHNALSFMAIPVFIGGIIKYGERTWVLRSSSTKCFRSSLLSPPDPGPDYVELLERKNKYNMQPVSLLERPKDWKYSDDFFGQANYLFERFKYLFAGLILGHYEREDCYSIIGNKSAEDAFILVEIELGFLYDVLYTKATMVYSRFGILLRCITSFSSISALITFSIIFDKRAYSSIDISITYVLLVGAVVLEVYALIILFYSDWINLWLVKHQNSCIQEVKTAKRWSGTIRKLNLLKFCLKEEASVWIKVQRLLGIHEILEKHLSVTRQDVDAELEDMIFHYLRGERLKIFKEDSDDVDVCKELLKSRGKYVLEENGLMNDLGWSTVEVEFDHSLLLWHIATQLCYYADKREVEDFDYLDHYSKVSKCLSEYLLHLLVLCPKMLPKGIGELRYRDTCAEAVTFFKRRRDEIGTDVGKASELLFQVEADRSVLKQLKGNKTKSVLFYASSLARQLQSLNCQPNWGRKKKWETVTKVWIELLCYAAVHCGWKEHAQQLGQGGEWLTHVCLLMAHLGLSEQYQEQRQYVWNRPDRLVLHPTLVLHPRPDPPEKQLSTCFPRFFCCLSVFLIC